MAPVMAVAQGGPPLITNDPDTPGPGAWEINIAATGDRSARAWTLDAPDVDINHGVGERVQLSMHAPWSHRRDEGGAWFSGMGPIEFGVRWRFLDQAQAGVSVAVQPLWIRSFSPAAERHGLNAPNPEWVLPLQVSRHFDHSALGGEIARHVVANEPDTWQAGGFFEYDCRPRLQCLGEINTTWEDGPNTVLNAGGRQAITQHVNLLMSIGTQISGREEARSHVLFYLGAQLNF
jgi:hypothetical protein